MRLGFFLAWRFLFSRHRSGFVRLLTYLSIGSVGLALSAFILVMSVMNGFDRDLQSRIVGSIGAVRGFSLGGALAYTPDVERAVLETPGVTAATPELQLSALLREAGGKTAFAPATEAQVIAAPIPQKIKTSPLEKHLLGLSALPGEFDILLGSALADKLAVEAGDSVEAILLSPASIGGVVGGSVQETFRVSGRYRTGYYEIDAAQAILPVERVRRLMGLPPALAHTIEIAVGSPSEAPAVTARLEERLAKDGLYFRSWRDMREPLFRAVNLEKRVMAIILSLFGLVAVFSVLSALTSTAVEKRRELAALRAMGMRRRGVSAVLLMAGAIAGGLGLILGAVLSVSGHLMITRSDLFLLPSDVYDLDRLPSEWSTPLFAAAASALFVLALLASLVPAIVQARKSPSEALREE